MKFYGIPNQLVSQRIYNVATQKSKIKPLFRFNEEGEYETGNEALIRRLKMKFKHDDSVIHKCKYCDFETSNMGKLMAHYREHKRSEENVIES